MSKKKKHAEEEEEEETAPFWMISFSDLMTLLLSFFILLFSVSTVEQKKLKEMAESMNARFMMHGNRSSGDKLPTADPNLPKSKYPQKQESSGSLQLKIPPQAEFKTLTGTVVVFQNGNDVLSEHNKQILTQLAERLRGSPVLIQVEGHAAGKEIYGSVIYRSVDDLAYTRAYNTREFLVSKGLNAAQMTIVVAGQYHPLQDNVLFPLGENSYVEIIETDKKFRK
ncbi:MAG: OmpA family protein [Planctomycetaceae bacterium]|jgi:chemotaxis protein MotB|nr:OmpA family protein [Planctomycetaceae bacterium]